MQFFPRNVDFFKLFDKQVEQIQLASDCLKKLNSKKKVEEVALDIQAIEHEADTITHEVFHNLNQTFITPIDREDIIFLASRLDDIIDAIYRTIGRMDLYQISPNTREISEYIHLLTKAIDEVIKATRSIHNPSKNQHDIIKHSEIINFVENQVDELTTRAIGDLVNNSKDAIMVIKLKEIFEGFESVADRCEDVANVLETIVVKNQ
jgi:uncharacterized protein